MADTIIKELHQADAGQSQAERLGVTWPAPAPAPAPARQGHPFGRGRGNGHQACGNGQRQQTIRQWTNRQI